ncbi:MAG: crossover junction endodeoxyribonuclease RuvC, partial [Bacteroidales bacterium]|nr:crossover junction endodeoxyribonuclease RuvC [Bacteroidales bacterium]
MEENKINSERIILGIDPGTNVTGYGIIKVTSNKPEMMVLGIIDLTKIDDPYVKLKYIFDRVTGIID